VDLLEYTHRVARKDTTMSTTLTPIDPRLEDIRSLLDRLDPSGGVCDVPGCIHHRGDNHDATWVGDALAA